MRREAKACPDNVSSENGVVGQSAFETFVAALAEIIPRFNLVAIGESELSQMKIDFPQPPDVWRFGDVRGAPCQIVLRGPLLMEETWELSADHAGNPVHHEDLAAGEPLGLVQHCNGVFHVADAVEQGNRGGVLGPQQTDGAQIKSLLRIAKTRAEFVQARGEEFGAFQLLVGIGVCPHEKEQQLRILWRCGTVDRFQVFELRAGRDGLSLARADSGRSIFFRSKPEVPRRAPVPPTER